MNASVKSARRVLEILELFAASDRALGLKDVAGLLGLPKSSAHMLLATLEQRGYLVREADDRFMLLPGLRAAGGWVGGMLGQVFRAAHPVMDTLLERFDETVVLGAPTPGLDVRIVSHRPSRQAIRYDVSRDPVLPGYCTAMGHAVLCHLPEDEVRAYLARTRLAALTPATVTDPEAIIARLRQCRAQGYATNIDERFEGAAGVAVAILGPDRRPHAALNIVTVTPRFHRRRDEIVPALIEAARGLEQTAFGPSAGSKPEGRLSA